MSLIGVTGRSLLPVGFSNRREDSHYPVAEPYRTGTESNMKSTSPIGVVRRSRLPLGFRNRNEDTPLPGCGTLPTQIQRSERDKRFGLTFVGAFLDAVAFAGDGGFAGRLEMNTETQHMNKSPGIHQRGDSTQTMIDK